jgi:hypothetical protein
VFRDQLSELRSEFRTHGCLPSYGIGRRVAVEATAQCLRRATTESRRQLALPRNVQKEIL